MLKVSRTEFPEEIEDMNDVIAGLEHLSAEVREVRLAAGLQENRQQLG